MSELIQYIQALPIKPLMWIGITLVIIAFIFGIFFVSAIFFSLFHPKKKRSFWDV